MSTPSVIRHAVCGDEAAMVITSLDRREQQFLAYFQTYLVSGEGGRTGMTHSEIWTTEQAAIKLFDERVAEEARDDS
jgi:hypothetical protein